MPGGTILQAQAMLHRLQCSTQLNWNACMQRSSIENNLGGYRQQMCKGLRAQWRYRYRQKRERERGSYQTGRPSRPGCETRDSGSGQTGAAISLTSGHRNASGAIMKEMRLGGRLSTCRTQRHP